MKFETVTLNHFLWPRQPGQEGKISSRKIAEYFGKQHKHVIRDIEALDSIEDFAESNFGPGSYLDKNGQQRTEILMTRQGCFYLIMGYTGSKAAKIKVELLIKFDQLEKRVREQEKRYWREEARRQGALKEALDIDEEGREGLECLGSDNDLLESILGLEGDVNYNTIYNT